MYEEMMGEKFAPSATYNALQVDCRRQRLMC